MPSLLFAIVLFAGLAIVTAVETYLGYQGVAVIAPLEDLMLGVGFTAVFALPTGLGYWCGFSARSNRFSVYGENARAVTSGLIASALVWFTPDILPDTLSHKFISPVGSVLVFATWLLTTGALLAWIPLPLRWDKQRAA